jgi:anti-sigma factor RsiW
MMTDKRKNDHFSDGFLWQYHLQEWDATTQQAVTEHLQTCAACSRTVGEVARLIQVMQNRHYAIKPDWAEQTRLLRAIRSISHDRRPEGIWVEQSRRLIRWLTPSVAVLIIAFLLLHPESNSTRLDWSEWLTATPESRLVFPRSEMQMKEELYELVASQYQNQ